MNALATVLMTRGISGTPEEVVAHLSEAVAIATDDTPYTWSGVNERLIAMGVDPTIVAGWDQALPAIPGGSMLDRMLSSGGVDFSGPILRQMLGGAKENADPQVQAVMDALLSIGVQPGQRWQITPGLSGLPTADECKVALDQVAKQKYFDKLRSTVIEPLLAQDKSTEEIKIAIAAFAG